MENTNKVQRSEMWEQIYKIVKQIPRKEVGGDAMDAPSAATEIEKYFLKTCNLPQVSVSLLERAASLVGNPATNISSSTDIACDEWQKDYERWSNER